MSISNDVLAHIIINVEDVGTLFSLLTVSRHVFLESSRALYRDPMYSLSRTVKHYVAIRKFVWLVLSITPCKHESIHKLRAMMNVQAADRSPMLDYLSLIRVVRWEYVRNSLTDDWKAFETNWWREGRSEAASEESFVKKALAMAICHHRLDSIVEIEIQSPAIEEYIRKASEFSCLKTMVISVKHHPNIAYAYSRAISLVVAIQDAHGKGLLQDCQVLDTPPSFPVVDVFDLKYELSSRLPLSPWLHSLPIESPQPMDHYLARLNRLQIDSFEWTHILRYYHDKPLARIFQCCRELIVLRITSDVIKDENVFAWAAQEARDRVARKPMPPAVPLENLHLAVTSLDANGVIRMIRDTLVGFAESLCFLSVYLVPQQSQPNNDNGDCSLLVPQMTVHEYWMLPRLDHIDFTAVGLELFDPHLLLSCPKIRMLRVKLHRDYPHNIDSPLCSWPLILLPGLRELRLEGAAGNLFDPAGFANMESLDFLRLEFMSEDPSPDLSSRMQRWTWDWHLPNLTCLAIQSGVEGWFSLGVLRSCPKLTILDLQATRKLVLEVRSVLEEETNNSFETVKRIVLGQTWDLTLEDFHYLLHHVLPCLAVADFRGFGSCSGRQAVETTRSHPTLRHARFGANVLSLEEREEMGFCLGRNNSCSFLFGNGRRRYYWHNA